MRSELIKLARPEIVAMKAYSSARSEASQGRVWLDANENPWNNNLYNRYPEPQPESLVAKLSDLYATRPDQVLVTRGSDEGIDLIVRLFCRAGEDKILICPPTYGLYQVAATIQGAGVVRVPLVKARNFAIDPAAILAAWEQKVKVIFLCSPNNPTGNLLLESDIVRLCEELRDNAIIVVDEAYLEFSTGKSLAQYLNAYPNLIVLRTLSKAYGLAGLRCGVTLAHQDIVQLLKKIIAPYPIPQPISGLALQSLNLKGMSRQIENILQERQILARFLETLPFVKKVWQSDTNFLLLEVLNPAAILSHCFKQGIVLRDRSHEPQLENCIRITVGNPNENQFLIEVLSRA